MGTSVTVSSYLLEDIFRLLDYLDIRSGFDELHFQKSGYGLRIEHDNAFRELKIKISQLQSQIMDTYLLTIGDITEDEMKDLRDWVNAGKSVYENPCLICDESGRPMDFISACRMDLEMDDELPF